MHDFVERFAPGNAEHHVIGNGDDVVMGLFGEGGELVDGGGPVEVEGDQQRAPVFLFQAEGEFCRGGGGGT